MYLEWFTFPDADREWSFRMGVVRTCYNTMYPFGILSGAGLSRLDFERITILYGGNGCGKTTALNVIAEKLKLARETPFNRSSFFSDYVELCNYGEGESIPEGSRIITSDDVFDFMLNLRSLNDGIDRKREELFEDYYEARSSVFRLRSVDDYEELKKRNSARRKTQSKFVRGELPENVREQSNGESAFFYFTNKIGEDALFILDEPENSLSPTRQMELAKFLEESARYLGCQLIISTHSPFLLAMGNAKIYDLDERPADIKNWTELSNVRAQFDFFKKHEKEFE